MSVKPTKPISNSARGYVAVQDDSITTKKSKPIRSSSSGVSYTKAGRNNYGRITSYQKGGRSKRLFREIDFKRNKDGVSGKIVQIEYDPNRSSSIALVVYADGDKRYILSPMGLNVGAVITNGVGGEPTVGNCMPISSIPVGTQIHNIELKPAAGGQIVRSAGSFAQLVAKEDGYAQLRMPSGEIRKILLNCRATIGQVGNAEHGNRSLGKAGRSRWLGRRPHVRGVAMNPVDHPHGGGEGRTSGGRHPVTPWAKGTKGLKTRNNKRTQKFVLKRRKTKK
jgi:large subunit ribosomal protein L2